jgi:transposase
MEAMNDTLDAKPETKTKPRQYDQAFKLQAVALVVDQGRKVREVARDLGISEFLLYDWRRQLRPKGALPGAAPAVKGRTVAELEADNAALRRELEYVRQQRDILTKTLGILSEPPPNATPGSRR